MKIRILLLYVMLVIGILVSPELLSQVPVANFSININPQCSSRNVVITDMSTNTPTAWLYLSSTATPSMSAVQNPTFTYASAGTYTIGLLCSNASGTSTPVVKTITINPTPTVTVVSNPTLLCSGQTATLTSNGATTYTWFPVGSTGSTLAVSPTVTTTYTVIGRTGSCSQSTAITQSVSTCTGVQQLTIQTGQFNLYPNPNSGSFKLQIENEISDGEIVLFNSLGQKVHEQKISRGENSITTNNLARGLYHYTLLQNKGQIGTGKLIIE